MDWSNGAIMKPDSQARVGLIGLGLMGMALAERLQGGGFDVWGYDISARISFGCLPAAGFTILASNKDLPD
jgi:3-hydroxyisobutyrate dehydrogenase-like beta-hydroxyacid dehydrogenase